MSSLGRWDNNRLYFSQLVARGITMITRKGVPDFSISYFESLVLEACECSYSSEQLWTRLYLMHSSQNRFSIYK